jgi:uncharacterized protein YjiS (DUF1127 family)
MSASRTNFRERITRPVARIGRWPRRRSLARLSDRQLSDAGIDLSLVRGKAAAAGAATLRRLLSLSFG